ncbi:hypothetical protein QQS21_000394 [Conoideocrella luteorostrata]|uniref:Methyltransferase type 11 domain-containing protein n=1 Tax=Conoideocrella luteorostrata TaxID=1105319 RepID=A0AAJ0D0X7_9HYPO|nr:hypothetical protein QQS21_000394 [Conoideocrella luteorostrata]
MAPKGRFASIFGPFRLIWLSIEIFYDTAKEAIRRDGLAALGHPRRIQDVAVAKLLSKTSDGFIAYEDTTTVPSLVKTAEGKILELGPGPGNQIHRYDQSLVEFIYAIEPNPNFKDDIAAKVKNHDLQDRYKLISCGVEGSDILRREGITEGSVDTVLSIQVLCAVEDVRMVMREVWKLLRPGGKFVFWEHGRSKDAVTAVTQACWNPAWSTLVGCHMNRDILTDILAAGEWENPGDVERPDDPHSCLPRTWGVLIKKA